MLSIIFSFLCSIWEAVLLSITPSFIKLKQQDSPSLGNLLAKFKDDIDTPLSAILTLNTIAHTVGAIGVGAQAAEIFGTRSASIFGFEFGYESIIAAAMTLAILILSEIIPKTIGANNWQRLSNFTARSLVILTFVLKPFIWIAKLITKSLNKGGEKSVFSRRDYAAMTDAVGESGQIKKADHTLIKNVLGFDELTAKDVMTPRTVMVMADENQTIEKYFQNKKFLQFSRIPTFSGSRDTITGTILKDDLLLAVIEGKGDEQLKTIKRDISIVPENFSLRRVFEEINDRRIHIAVVVDQYGGVSGLISMEDVFETLFGREIMDETDSVSDLQAYARKKWEERAKKLGLNDED